MSLAAAVLAAALGVVKVVDLVKQVYPSPLASWQKNLLTLVLGFGLSALLTPSLRDWFLLGLFIAGLSSVVHDLQRLASALADERRQTVILRSNPANYRRSTPSV